LIHRADENRILDLKKQTEGVMLENDSLAVELTKLQIQIKTAKEEIQQIINQDESRREYLDNYSGLSADQTFSLILSRTYFKGRQGVHLKSDQLRGRGGPKGLFSPSSQEASVNPCSKSLLDHQPKYLCPHKPTRNHNEEDHLSVSNNHRREDSCLLSQNISLTGSSRRPEKSPQLISPNFNKKENRTPFPVTAFSLNISNLNLKHRKSLEVLVSPKIIKQTIPKPEFTRHDKSPKEASKIYGQKKSDGCLAVERLMKKFKDFGNKKFGELSMDVSARISQLDAMMSKAQKEIDKQMKNSRKAGILALNVILAFKKAFYVLKYYESLELSRVGKPALLSSKAQRLHSRSLFSTTHQLLHQLSLDFIADIKRLDAPVLLVDTPPLETPKEPSMLSPIPLQKKGSPSTSTNPRSLRLTETCSKDDTVPDPKKGKELEVIREHQKSPEASLDRKVFNVIA
jgi:hypothetical protein